MSWSTIAGLLSELAALSPMPDDHALLDDETGLADRYDDLIEQLRQALSDTPLSHAEEAEVVTILADSFGLGGGMGIYWGTLHLIELIEQRSPSVAYPIVQDKAIHGHVGSRYWCCLLLGRRRSPDDVPLVLALLGDESSDVRRQALHALIMLAQKMPLQNAVPRIEPLLHDADSGVRKVAQQALASVGT